MKVHPIFKKYVTPTPMPVPPVRHNQHSANERSYAHVFCTKPLFSSSDGRDDGGHRLTLAVVLNAIIFS